MRETQIENSEIFKVISRSSPALLRHITCRPELFADIETLSKTKTSKIVSRAAEQIFEDETNAHNMLKLLRYFKYNALSALSFQYLTKKIGAQEFSKTWSLAARLVVRKAFEAAWPKVAADFGEPHATDKDGNEIDFKFVILAVGKLGAGELNLSSDIDLIFLYNTDKGYIKDKPTKTLNEFASKLSNEITSLISKIDEDGFCFRVDSNLRPEGSRGPIANSVDAAINFYDHWGTELERMMFIRACPIAGDLELGEEFLSNIKPFVYRKSLDVKSLAKIKEMKEKIRQEALKSEKDGINIKLGEGGIREVEFVVGSLQLIHGGNDKKLITKNTFDCLDVIKRKYLPSRQAKQLKEAYTFLRHIENMLQLPDDEQVHTLPMDNGQRKALAERAGYEDTPKLSAPDQMMADFDRHTEVVKYHFQHMFETNFERQQMEEAILTNISTCEDDEEDVDSLAWFRKEETKKIQYLDLEEKFPIKKVSDKLSNVADVVITEAHKIASRGLRKLFGAPLASAKGKLVAGLAIVGVGKLGGREIDYASDLDIMFIFSGEGSTSGPKKISNQEYFTKLSQRIISLISLPTRYGRAYQIDADLRPSGRAGVLVTSIESLKNYHYRESMIWERQALLKARPIAGDPNFCDVVEKLIEELCFGAALPHDYKKQITDLRARMENEKAKETKTRFNIKLGPGGLIDVETIVQYLQLKHGQENKSIRSGNTLDCLTMLKDQHLIPSDIAEEIVAGYLFLRRLLSRIRLFSNHAVDYLDTDSDRLEQIAKTLGLETKEHLIEKFNKTRNTIRKIYNKYMT